jgi:hypothetical protein
MAARDVSCSCSSFIQNLLFCCACHSHDHPQVPAIPASPPPLLPAAAAITHHVPNDPANIPANQHTTHQIAAHHEAITDASTTLQLQIIPADTTVDTLDSLIKYLENLSNTVGDPCSQEWNKFTGNVPAFLESLARRQEA